MTRSTRREFESVSRRAPCALPVYRGACFCRVTTLTNLRSLHSSLTGIDLLAPGTENTVHVPLAVAGHLYSTGLPLANSLGSVASSTSAVAKTSTSPALGTPTSAGAFAPVRGGCSLHRAHVLPPHTYHRQAHLVFVSPSHFCSLTYVRSLRLDRPGRETINGRWVDKRFDCDDFKEVLCPTTDVYDVMTGPLAGGLMLRKFLRCQQGELLNRCLARQGRTCPPGTRFSPRSTRITALGCT